MSTRVYDIHSPDSLSKTIQLQSMDNVQIAVVEGLNLHLLEKWKRMT